MRTLRVMLLSLVGCFGGGEGQRASSAADAAADAHTGGSLVPPVLVPPVTACREEDAGRLDGGAGADAADPELEGGGASDGSAAGGAGAGAGADAADPELEGGGASDGSAAGGAGAGAGALPPGWCWVPPCP